MAEGQRLYFEHKFEEFEFKEYLQKTPFSLEISEAEKFEAFKKSRQDCNKRNKVRENYEKKKKQNRERTRLCRDRKRQCEFEEYLQKTPFSSAVSEAEKIQAFKKFRRDCNKRNKHQYENNEQMKKQQKRERQKEAQRLYRERKRQHEFEEYLQKTPF